MDCSTATSFSRARSSLVSASRVSLAGELTLTCTVRQPAIIIVGLFMVPVLILTSQALTTVETVRGLETKMTGHVGIDAAKSG